jgi:hypothetical protein
MGKYPLGRREAVKIAQAKAVSVGLEKNDGRPHQLQLLAAFDPATNTYQVPINARDQEKIAPDFAIGLADRDAMIVTGANFQVMSVPVIDGSPVFAAAIPVGHADARVFTGASTVDSKLSEAQMINAFYMATFDIQSGTKKRIENHSILPFRRAGTTQFSAAAVNEQNGCEIEELGVSIVFSGADNSHLSIALKCPYKSLIAGDATRKNYMLITLDGAIIVNAVNKLFSGQ